MPAERSPRRTPWFPAVSVRVRILASILLVAAAGMVAAGTTAYFVQRDSTLDSIDAALVGAVNDARFIATDSKGTTLNAVLEAVVQQIRPGTNEATLAIVNGAAALAPGGDVDFRLEENRGFVARVVGETATGKVVLGNVRTDGRAVRYVAAPVSVAGDPAAGVFVAAFDLDAALRPVTDALLTSLRVTLAALVVLGLVGWLVSGRLLRPIRALREAAARITASDVSERIPVVGRDDVSELTRTVNDMLDRLDGALTGQRRLLDDVGHELKTPITIVRGHLELMDEDDPADVAATRALAIDELDRMNGLVRDISALAEVQRPLGVTRAPVDIAVLTELVRTKAAALSGHRWVTTETADLVVPVDAGKLTQALLQLAANAVSHGSADGTIEIGSATGLDSTGNPRLRFWVRDEGPGISADAQEHIFERFRRGATGRGSTGSGLGLAIVRAIAEAHGGTVSVASAPGRGATFTIDLPLPPGDGAPESSRAEPGRAEPGRAEPMETTL
ncbi:cell wall metabolism sensor histidine kinase WalK [Cryobacterium sp. HLT2-28]|uniref:sensor histidine kinase n=1 Tax=Cryobacterium sp. HLT2-28 TaxID=1259146 RepID=UPI00106AC108|nr:HAMP domain-containing sensor histidine kinase [Cryobacterium sp. HLT2-28]TFB94107.1 HAMP domain-containing histidine kinase [Cryobacterium sp. HLT2-28]